MITIPPLLIIWFADLLFFIPWIIIILVSHLVVAIEERGLIDAFGGFKITPLLDEPHVIAVVSRGYLYLGEVAGVFGKVGRGARTVKI